ncbi:MAG: FCD domain-containing protein [Aureliella sp.]
MIQLPAPDFEELLSLRLLLELAAARMAFPLNQKPQRLLEANISATRNAKTLEEVTRLDLHFHEMIVVASRCSRDNAIVGPDSLVERIQ